MEEKELEKKIVTYQYFQNRLDTLSKQQAMILTKISEIDTSIQSLKNLKKGEVVFSLGSGIYAFGKLSKEDKFLVEIGAGILLEKNLDESVKSLEKRKKDLQKVLGEIQNEINFSSNILNQLASEINESIKNVRKT